MIGRGLGIVFERTDRVKEGIGSLFVLGLGPLPGIEAAGSRKVTAAAFLLIVRLGKDAVFQEREHMAQQIGKRPPGVWRTGDPVQLPSAGRKPVRRADYLGRTIASPQELFRRQGV